LLKVSVPLRGFGLESSRFEHRICGSSLLVSVPLRGFGLESGLTAVLSTSMRRENVSVPLRGFGLESINYSRTTVVPAERFHVSVPLRGFGLERFLLAQHSLFHSLSKQFPSPCGDLVWKGRTGVLSGDCGYFCFRPLAGIWFGKNTSWLVAKPCRSTRFRPLAGIWFGK